MNSTELKELKSQIEQLKKTIFNEFLYLEGAVRSMEESKFGVSHEIPVALGDRVRVYATCADMEGSSIEGLEAEVVAIPDANNTFAKAITVRMLEAFKGQEFRVYPEQCQRTQDDVVKLRSRSKSRAGT